MSEKSCEAVCLGVAAQRHFRSMHLVLGTKQRLMCVEEAIAVEVCYRVECQSEVKRRSVGRANYRARFFRLWVENDDILATARSAESGPARLMATE